MKTTFTKSTANFGCYAKHGQSKQNDFLPNEDFTILEVINSSAPLRDKAWFIRNNCQLTETENREFAIGCDMCALPIYEEKYPGNKAPREAIEAAKAYLKNDIGLYELQIKIRAAITAATATADAAAAYAAYAATATADTAAAAYAAYADADTAADEISYKDILLTFFKDFTNAE